MSGASGGTEEPAEDLAGEYVLGCLDATSISEAKQRLLSEPGFAAEVRAWERRLLPLAALVAELTPPHAIWERLEEAIASAAAPAANDETAGGRPTAAGNVAALRRSVRLWQISTLASLGLAATVALVTLLRPVPLPAVAALAPAGEKSGLFLAMARPDGTLVLHAVSAVSVPKDRDLQLWSLPQGGATPASLGVLPADGVSIGARPAAGSQLLVSLEPAGGSPTGAPTGPVLYSGRLIAP